MMQSTNDLLTVLMDGIRDTGMLIGYAENALMEGQSGRAAWFRNHAKKRLDQLEADYNDVGTVTGMAEKARSGD